MYVSSFLYCGFSLGKLRPPSLSNLCSFPLLVRLAFLFQTRVLFPFPTRVLFPSQTGLLFLYRTRTLFLSQTRAPLLSQARNFLSQTRALLVFQTRALFPLKLLQAAGQEGPVLSCNRLLSRIFCRAISDPAPPGGHRPLVRFSWILIVAPSRAPAYCC